MNGGSGNFTTVKRPDPLSLYNTNKKQVLKEGLTM